MTEAKKVTLVSVVAIDDGYTFGRAASYVGDHETVEECIAQCKSDALEDFNDNGGGSIYRIVVQRTTIPLPCADDMPHIEVVGVAEDKTGAPVTVTAEIS